MSINLGSAYAELKINVSGFSQGLNAAKLELGSFKNDMNTLASDMVKLGKNLEGSGKLLTKSVTVPIAGLGAAAVKTTADFDSAMSQVYATMGDKAQKMVEYNGKTISSMQALREYAQKMGAETKFSASEAADALNYMALAGYDAETSMAMLPNVLNLAAAGNMELATASDMVTDTQTAFGISLDRTTQMVDEMAKAASTGNTSVEQLGEAFLTVGGLAQELNGGMIQLSDGTMAEVDNVQELEIALTAMANAGIKGSEAGTHMRNMLLKLSSPTEDGYKAFQKLGVSVYDTEGNMRSLNDIFKDLNVSFESLTQEEKLQAISDIFNTRDTAAAEAILSAIGEDWNTIGEEILHAGGAAQTMAETQIDNLNGQMTILKSTLESLLIQIGDILVPYVSRLVDKIRNVIVWLSSLSKEEKEQVIRIAAIAAAIGPVLLIIAKIISTVSTLHTGVAGLITFITAHPVISGIAISVGLLTAAVVKCKSETDQLYHSIADLTEEQQAMQEAAEQYNATIAQQIESNKSLLQTIDQEYASQQGLIEELQSITDENGRVKQGYEDRAQVIVNELAQAFGIEIQYQDGVIQKYGEVMETIDQVIEKKKAEALLSANQQAYVEALEQQKEKYEALKSAQEAYTAAVDGQKVAKEKLKKAEEDYNWAMQGNSLSVTQYMKAFQEAGTEAEAYEDKVKKSKAALDEQEKAFYNNQAVISNYTDLQKALEEGTVNLGDEITRFSNGLVEDASTDYLKQQAADAKTYYEQIVSDFESGQVSISQSQVDAAKANYEQAQKILDNALLMYHNGGKNAAQGYTDGFKDNSKAITNTVQASMKAAIDMVQRVNDSHSPSRRYKGLAKDAVTGYDLGLIENFPKAIQTVKDNLRLMLETIAASNPEFYKSGVRMFENLWNGMKSEWAKIQDWFEDVVRQAEEYAARIRAIMESARSAAGSHADGLAYVPYNGYIAQLHEGERVLTRNEAEAYNSGKSGSGGYTFIYNSPKAIDPYEADKLFRQSVRDVEEGFT